ncbi:MAG: hypothetical protein ACOY35_11960 [Bacillota bacterium]
MNSLVQDLRRKRLTFTGIFIVLTLLFGFVQYQWEQGKLTEEVLQWLLLGWRLSIGVLCLWFGYAVGINKQTTWFMTMLSVLHQVTSWLALLYFLYKSGIMLINAKKQALAGAERNDTTPATGEGQGKKTKRKSKK